MDWFSTLQTNCMLWFADLKADFILNFIEQDRWRYITSGLGATLKITFFAVLLGIAIGAVVAIVRSSADKMRDEMQPGLGRFFLRLADLFCRLYLNVIRGTPVVLQLMIMYYLIFSNTRNALPVAILAFGINSGAYVAEIIRSGIMSVDKGQFEAGRSMGFNYVATMRHIVLPQAVKNVLPALANEFIVLLKETSVAGFITVRDLTGGANIIRGTTYSAFFPLVIAALIYLAMVLFFTWLVGKLERRLRNSEH